VRERPSADLLVAFLLNIEMKMNGATQLKFNIGIGAGYIKIPLLINRKASIFIKIFLLESYLIRAAN
jgi:hypothetical protein